jgi:hypothetical protein
MLNASSKTQFEPGGIQNANIGHRPVCGLAIADETMPKRGETSA